jgi:hypothetical protein
MVKPTIHVLAVAAILFSAACAAPEYTYVKNSGQKTYFKVPHDWQQTGTDSLDDMLSGTNPDSATKAARQRAWWSVAYDASTSPDARHLVINGVTDQPIVYARISPLSQTQQNAVSLDMLRNVILPVTDDARAAATASTDLTDFELLHDEVLAPRNGLRGVRVVFDYVLGSGVMHTFDETALVNNDNSKLYLLIIRCSTACYQARYDELETIATSFTVRSQ